MAVAIMTVERIMEYLGVGPDKEKEVQSLRASAMEDIRLTTGKDPADEKLSALFDEAVRVQVWISYYAVRDAAKNTEFLRRYLSTLIDKLQLAPAGDDALKDKGDGHNAVG